MAITRATAEYITVSRMRNLLKQAGMDYRTVNGNNEDLNDAIGWAARQLGLTVADLTNVADSDLTGIAITDYDKFLDFTEYRTLQTISSNVIAQEPGNTLVEMVERRIARKLKQLQRAYAFEEQGLEGGYIILGSTQRADDTITGEADDE